ncbi:MAG: PorT family protein [Bacteroidia bacterium]|nr:PorT family protein [Bacteroidia bacterium]
MKKQSVWLSFLLLGGLYAQQGTIKVGAAFLPQSTWLLNQDDSDAGPELDYVSTWGFAGGITLGYNFTDYIGVGLDVLYSRQGQKYKGTESGADLTAQTSLNYLKLPLLLRFNSDPNSPVQFSFFLGPQLSLLTGYKDEATFSAGNNSEKLEVSGTKATYTISVPPFPSYTQEEELTAPIYRSSNFGAALGLGVGIKLSDELLLSLHFRGDYSFGDVENKDAAIPHGNHSDPYWEQKPKYELGSHGSSTEKRPATSAITGGLMLGISYNIAVK